MIKSRIPITAILVWLIFGIGLASPVHAVNINHGGYGQVLIYPYYTASDGNVTLLTIVNDTEHAKAVKIRLLESKIGLPALWFNIYLAAKDMWVGSVQNDGGTVTLKTSDTSCTVPYVYRDGGLPVDGESFAPINPELYEDLLPMTEGHIEVIEMGTIMEGSDSEGYITLADGEPVDCDAILRAWAQPDDTDPSTRGYWLMNPLTDISRRPSGGLFGGAAIVNAVNGTLYSYNAVAINGFATDTFANDLLHSEPVSILPNLNSGNVYTGYVSLDNGANTSAEFGRGVDAVSYVLMQDSIANQYIVGDSLGVATDWVVTFPTKWYYFDPFYNRSEEVLAPFTRAWDGNGACEVVHLDVAWQGSNASQENVSAPKIPGKRNVPVPLLDTAGSVPLELCYSTNVISFGPYGNEVFNNGFEQCVPNDTEYSTPGYHWARLELDDYSWDENGNEIVDCDENGVGSECFSRDALGNLQGLPIVGFGIQRYTDGLVGQLQYRTTQKLDEN